MGDPQPPLMSFSEVIRRMTAVLQQLKTCSQPDQHRSLLGEMRFYLEELERRSPKASKSKATDIDAG